MRIAQRDFHYASNQKERIEVSDQAIDLRFMVGSPKEKLIPRVKPDPFTVRKHTRKTNEVERAATLKGDFA